MAFEQKQTTAPAENLRTLREAAGLSQSKLAERTGMEKTFISRLENGTPIGAKSAMTLAEYFGVPVSLFYKPKRKVRGKRKQ